MGSPGTWPARKWSTFAPTPADAQSQTKQHSFVANGKTRDQAKTSSIKGSAAGSFPWLVMGEAR
jgi:hypothetical protein